MRSRGELLPNVFIEEGMGSGMGRVTACCEKGNRSGNWGKKRENKGSVLAGLMKGNCGRPLKGKKARKRVVS